jgi:endoglucanase Acf2
MFLVIALVIGSEFAFSADVQDASDFDPTTVVSDLVVEVVHIQHTTGDDVIRTMDTNGEIWMFYAKGDHDVTMGDILILKIRNGRVIGASIN